MLIALIVPLEPYWRMKQKVNVWLLALQVSSKILTLENVLTALSIGSLMLALIVVEMDFMKQAIKFAKLVIAVASLVRPLLHFVLNASPLNIYIMEFVLIPLVQMPPTILVIKFACFVMLRNAKTVKQQIASVSLVKLDIIYILTLASLIAPM
jgi:hypothetical protein